MKDVHFSFPLRGMGTRQPNWEPLTKEQHHLQPLQAQGSISPNFAQTDTVGSHGHIVINSMFTSSLEIFKRSVMGVKKHFLRLFQSCSNCSSGISRKGLYQVGQFWTLFFLKRGHYCTLVNSEISVNSFLGFALKFERPQVLLIKLDGVVTISIYCVIALGHALDILHVCLHACLTTMPSI